MARSSRRVLDCLAALLLGGAASLPAATVVAITNGALNVSTTQTNLTALVAGGTVTKPMWYEVRAGGAEGPLLDHGAHAAGSPWPFTVRHLRAGPNVVTVFALDTSNVTASAAVTLTLDLGAAPAVRPRPRPAEIWWGGLSTNQQLLDPARPWEFVQRHQDGYFFHSAGYGGLTSVDKSNLAVRLRPFNTRFCVELGGGAGTNYGWNNNPWAAHLTSQQNLGLVMSDITHDYHMENMEDMCRAHPDWPPQDLVAYFTGDLAVATTNYPHPSGQWRNAFLNYYAGNAHLKLGITSSPVYWSWDEFPFLQGAWNNLLYAPLTDTNGAPVLVNGKTVSFSFNGHDVLGSFANMVNTIGRPWFNFHSDAPWDYFGTWGIPSAAATFRAKIRAYEQWFQAAGKKHTLICNVSNAGSRPGGDDAQDLYYKQSSLNSMVTHQQEGGRADRYLFESWYYGIPHAAAPETKDGSFANLARDAIRHLKGLTTNDTFEPLALTLLSTGLVTTAQLRNDGSVACLPALLALESAEPALTTRYFNAAGRDITAEITSPEGYAHTNLLQPGASTTFTVVTGGGGPAPAAKTISLEAFWNPQDPTGRVRDRGSFTVSAATLISTGAVWRFLDTGSDPGPAWRSNHFNDSGWRSGPAQLGFGDGDEATLVASNRQVTTWFRRSFVLSNAADVTSLGLRLLRDDGAVVYLNGTEVFRSNMPTGEITSATLATNALPQDETTNFYAAAVSPALLVNGTNVVAVEVHQSSPTSSDLSFDFELSATFAPPLACALTSPPADSTFLTNSFTLRAEAEGATRVEFFANGLKIAQANSPPFTATWSGLVPARYTFTARATDAAGRVAWSFPARVTALAPTETLIAQGATWKYRDTGVNLGTAWRERLYNDGAWPAGPAQLGAGDGDEATVINIGPANARWPTVYFRRGFNLTNAADIEGLSLRLLRDDGAVVYLNGSEVFRDNMPAEPILYTTLASTSAEEPGVFHSAVISPAALLAGLNVLAVEVHQSSATSSDLSFDFELTARRRFATLPPTATLTSPSPYATLPYGPVPLVTAAGDADGLAFSADYYVDGAWVGRSYWHHYTWTPPLAGYHTVQALVTDDLGAQTWTAPAFVSIPFPARAYAASGDAWRYWDSSTPPAGDWNTAAYDDTAWSAGPSQLGFGDGDEATVVDTNRQRVTTYFRRLVHVASPSGHDSIQLRLLRDDGAVVYLNGLEVFRSNMPDGPITPATFALAATPDENAWFATNLSPALFLAGTNLLAVEVHQSGTNSSDLSFDLELLGLDALAPPPLTVTTLGSQLQFAWPAWAAGLALHSATNLAPPAFWEREPTPPAGSGGLLRVTVPISAHGQRFFRLQSP